MKFRKVVKNCFLMTIKFKDRRRKDLLIIIESDNKPTLALANKIADIETIYLSNIISINPIRLDEIENLFGRKYLPWYTIENNEIVFNPSL